MTTRNRSGSRTSTNTAISAAVLVFLVSWTWLDFKMYAPPLAFQIAWFIVGSSIGVFFSALITRKQLRTIEKKGEDATTLKTLFITIGIVVVVLLAFLELSFSNVSMGLKGVVLYSFIGFAPAFQFSRAVLLKRWEWRNQTTIYQDKFGLYVPTKNPVDYIEGQGVSNQAVQNGARGV